MMRPSNFLVFVTFASALGALVKKEDTVAELTELTPTPSPSPHLCPADHFNGFGYISSPDYPDCYPNNARCDWSLEAPAGQRVRLEFLGPFGLESCCDYVEIRDGPFSTSPLIGRFSGQNKPGVIASSGRSIYVGFSTDTSVVDVGFEIYYVFVNARLENEVSSNSTLTDQHRKHGDDTRSMTTLCNSWPGSPTTPWPNTCSVERPCPPGRYCDSTGYCICADAVYSVGYNDNCSRKVGATCVLNSADPANDQCIPRANCVARNATHGRCECHAGLVGTDNGYCDGDYGAACVEVDDQWAAKCSQRLLLTCRNAHCACASPSLTYEFGTGRGCVAPVMEPCNIRFGHDGHLVMCAQGLRCVEWTPGSFRCEA